MDEGILVVLITIIGSLSIPMTWFFFDNKSKERQARVMEKAIEAGHSPEEVMRVWHKSDVSNSPRAQKVRFRKGLVLIAVGSAFLVSHKLGYSNGDGGMVIAGMILLFLGIAFFLSDLMNGKEKMDS